MTRAKPGELCIVVSGFPEINRGRIVRVLRLRPLSFVAQALGLGPFWEYEGSLATESGGRAQGVQDSCLRPLRGDEGVDETIRIAGLPTEQRDDVPSEVAA